MPTFPPFAMMVVCLEEASFGVVASEGVRRLLWKAFELNAKKELNSSIFIIVAFHDQKYLDFPAEELIRVAKSGGES